jgi:hypothetical protein
MSDSHPETCPWMTLRPGQTRTHFARVALNLLLAFVAFVGVSRFFVPSWTQDEVLEAKLEHFRQHKDEYDLVFFGSSRVLRAFAPNEFDGELTKRKRAVRSFNFGIGHMRAHETDALIERVLALHPQRLKWVLVEVMEWTPTILNRMQNHDRTIDWHTPRQTMSACRSIWRSDRPFDAKLQWIGTHWAHMAAKYTSYGDGYRRFSSPFLSEERHQAWRGVIDRSRGFISLDQERDWRYAGRRREFIEKYFDVFAEQVRQIDSTNREPGHLGRFSLAAQRHQQQAIRDAGVLPIFVIPNLRWGTPSLNRLFQDGHLEHGLTFNHPSKFPNLYRRDRYFDRGHLNRRGAGEFSRLLAKRFDGWLTARQQ